MLFDKYVLYCLDFMTSPKASKHISEKEPRMGGRFRTIHSFVEKGEGAVHGFVTSSVYFGQDSGATAERAKASPSCAERRRGGCIVQTDSLAGDEVIVPVATPHHATSGGFWTQHDDDCVVVVSVTFAGGFCSRVCPAATLLSALALLSPDTL